MLEPVDLVLTDPPYGINANVKTHSTGRGRKDHTKGFDGRYSQDWSQTIGDDKPFDPSPFLDFPEVILWGANHFSDKLPVSTHWLIWDKRDGSPSDDNADCEIAWSNIPGPARLCHHYWRGWLRAGRENVAVEGRKLHSLQKPVALMKWCLQQSKTTGFVLDPFIGSGSTLVAAKELSRCSIGIEIEPKYCEIAVKRLRQEVFDFRKMH